LAVQRLGPARVEHDQIAIANRRRHRIIHVRADWLSTSLEK